MIDFASPPERPAIVRAADLSGLPTWQEMQRRENALREGTFPFPIMPPSKWLSAEYVDEDTDLTTQSTFTFSSQNFGTPSSDRQIFVLVSGSAVFTASLSSLTIGGVSGTIHVQNGSPFSAICRALVTTGTSGTVALTFSDNMLFACITVIAVRGLLSTTALETFSSNDTSAPLSVTNEMTLSAGGIILGVAMYCTNTASARMHTAAMSVFTSGSSQSVTVAAATSAATWTGINEIVDRNSGLVTGADAVTRLRPCFASFK